ncbi:MAG TPA: response regulator transcription factor [Kofleriaceae bacterium]|nr:response regulator transcription factor [Kofleriaceae bacterium]
MIRVLMVCDRALVRGGLRRMLDGTDDVGIAGEAANPTEALAVLAATPCDVAVVDFAMPLKQGLDAIGELCRQVGSTRVLVLGGHADQHQAQGALDAGASGFLWKGADGAELIEAIRTVERGASYLSPQVKTAAGNGGDDHAASLDTLSKRELEVMCFLASGMTNREIAEQLGISVKTIDTHRGHLLKKLQLRNNSDITRFAIRHGLVQL